MIRWIGQVVALPLQALEFMVSIVPVINPFPLCRAIWALTKDPVYAQKLIVHFVKQEGIDSARFFAEKAFAVCPDGAIAGVIGQLELQLGEIPDNAIGWLRRAKENPNLKNPDGLLGLEISLSRQVEEMDCAAIVKTVLSRNDLPINLTQLALFVQAHLLLKAEQWDQALQIADQILSIQEVPLARWIRWVVYSATQQQQPAQREFHLFSHKNSGPLYDALLASGYFYLGQVDRCREHLLKARQAGIPDRLIRMTNPDLARSLAELPLQTETPEAAS